MNAAIRFSSDDDDEDNELQASGQFAPSPLAEIRKRVSPSPPSVHNTVERSIPTLPTGRHLRLSILSTWGDPFYVGLAGLEIFAKSGFVVDLTSPEISVVANPPSVNVLGGDGKDPRTVDKLVDDHCHTCSDLHQWLAPWGTASTVTIDVDLGDETTLSMIRFWNYNKNRAHSYRGVRDVRVIFDSTVIFEGEVRRAAGGLKGPEECSDAVLFTIDEDILQAIEERDEALYPEFRMKGASDVSETLVHRIKRRMECDRPKTACGDDSFEREEYEERPVTKAGRVEGDEFEKSGGVGDIEADLFAEERPEQDEDSGEEDEDDIDAMMAEVGDGRVSFSPKATMGIKGGTKVEIDSKPIVNVKSVVNATTFQCDGVTIKIYATHETQIDKTRLSLSGPVSSGASSYVGLGAIRLLRHDGLQVIVQDVNADTIDATPRDLHTLGYTGDERKLTNLYSNDSSSISVTDRDMWLVPDGVTAGTNGDGSVEIRIKFGQRIEDLYAIQVWNYNKVARGDDGKYDADTFDEDTLRGASVVSVTLKNCGSGGNYPVGAFHLRRGPSFAGFDYGQTLELANPHGITPDDLLGGPREGMSQLGKRFKPCPNMRQDYETPFLPCGSIVKVVIHGGWGDKYFVGLDKFEIFDPYGKIVGVVEVGASPKDLSR